MDRFWQNVMYFLKLVREMVFDKLKTIKDSKMNFLVLVTSGLAIMCCTPGLAMQSSSHEQAAVLFKNLQGNQILIQEEEYDVASLCTYVDQELKGSNKVCYYRCGGHMTMITVSSLNVCPRSINN